MNPWTVLSIDFANQRNYLDQLFRVYPSVPEGLREIDTAQWQPVERAFIAKDNTALIEALLRMELFPLKDPYVAYFRHDPGAMRRNPETVNRLCGRLFELGLDELYERCSQPREVNRQVGPMFKRWLHGALGVPALDQADFLCAGGNCIMSGSDKQLLEFARRRLGHRGTKGVDFVARFNGTYVIGEAKFLTDAGGHQNAQFEDAKALLRDASTSAAKVAVLDGVLYIRGEHKMFGFLREHREQFNIMSALVLREFLYSL